MTMASTLGKESSQPCGLFPSSCKVEIPKPVKIRRFALKIWLDKAGNIFSYKEEEFMDIASCFVFFLSIYISPQIAKVESMSDPLLVH
jgi:hypothetical protein